MESEDGSTPSLDLTGHPLQDHGGMNHSISVPEQGDNSTFTLRDGPSAPLKDAHGRIPNPRSCVTCRRRKVKCDKTHPCNNCTRQHIECVYPAPGRAPRKPRKPGDPREAELLSRLRRLEAVVQRMGVDPVTEEGEQTLDTSMRLANLDSSLSPLIHHDSQTHTNKDVHPTDGLLDPHAKEDQPRVGPLESRFGRLVINEGKSRYINNSFWANLSTEVEDLKGIFNEQSDEDDDDASPTAFSAQNGQHQSWIFSYSSQNVDLLSLHPVPVQLATYWAIYKENVDPLVKVLHIPSIEPTVLAAASHLANLSKGFEALLFSIYYGAATSLSDEDCTIRLGEERSVLLARYRFAVEQSLARANFLTTEELVVLQAFVIYLICLRRNSAARVIWTLTGLVVRIAQTIGIHRDGEHFSLAPFEIEMRRRLWWQVCILDIRASEDHGCDPTITEQTFDTKMPLNVDDVDLDPRMKALPKERAGGTDITFSLIRFEVANTFRRLNYVPPGAPRAYGEFFSPITLEEKERWINECHQRLENKYLKHCDMSQPIYWVTATVARLMMTKMWLMVYHPFQRQDGGKRLSAEIKEKLFITSLENIEYSLLLQTEARTLKWGWLFKTYVQWHAFAFILVELCHRTRGDLVDRAWIAVENSKDARWADMVDRGHSTHLWRPLHRLMDKARASRKKALMEDQIAMLQSAHQPTAQSVHMGTATSPSTGSGARRPLVMRAPLSAAQIQRFMSPPIYGMKPIDSTQLMRSPRAENTIILDNATETPSLPSEAIEQLPPAEEQGEMAIPLVFEILDQQRVAAAQAAQLYAQKLAVDANETSTSGLFCAVGAESRNPSRPVDSFTNGGDMDFARNQQTSMPAPSPFSFGTAPMGYNNNMPSIMDGSIPSASRPELASERSENFPPMDAQTGEVDWATWDDVVRQFEMDVDQPGGSGPGFGGQGGSEWHGWGNGLGMGGGVIF